TKVECGTCRTTAVTMSSSRANASAAPPMNSTAPTALPGAAKPAAAMSTTCIALRAVNTSASRLCTRSGRARDRRTVEICTTLDEVFRFFGHSALAKKLYADAGLDDAVEA